MGVPSEPVTPTVPGRSIGALEILSLSQLKSEANPQPLEVKIIVGAPLRRHNEANGLHGSRCFAAISSSLASTSIGFLPSPG
jgi:hypothetical protein